MNILIIIIFIFYIIKHRFFWKVQNKNKFNYSSTIYISHRGYKKEFPENTMESFLHAHQLQYQWLELDVIATKDNVLVCSHNFDLEKETDGRGYIHKLNSNHLNYLTTGVYSKKITKSLIPKLNDVLIKLPDSIRINIEIKAPQVFDFKTARALGKMVKNLPVNRFLISSFNPIVLFYFKLFHKRLKTGFLYQNLEYFWITNWLHPNYIHPRADLIDNSLLEYCKQKNLGINTWTVNNKPAVEWCKSKNIDGIITDRGSSIW